MAEWILSSSILIAVVALVRLVFKGRINLRLQYALWGLVLLRLLIPFNIGSSAISVSNIAAQVKQDSVVQTEFQPSQNMPSEKVEHDPVASEQPERDPAPSGVVNEGQEPISPLPGTNADGEVWGAPTVPEVQNGELNASDGFGSMQLWINAAHILWIVGIVIVALTFSAVNLLFGFRIRRSRVPIAYAESKLPLFTTAAVDSPCLFGLIRPSIYLNPDAVKDPQFMRHSIVHETTHYRHGDHIWSMLRCVCLAIHWYNPLVWWAAFLSQRDAELACDESSIRLLGEQERQEYGHTLIGMTCQKKSNIFMISTTMTDSRKGLRERIILIARKPRMTVYTLLAVLLIAAVAVGCTFTGGRESPQEPETEEASTSEPTVTTGQPDLTEPLPTEPAPPVFEEYSGPSLDAGTIYNTFDEEKLCIGIVQTETATSMERYSYLIPGNQTVIQGLLDAALEHCKDANSDNRSKAYDTGWLIIYKGQCFRVFTDGTIAVNYYYDGVILPEHGYLFYSACKAAAQEAGLPPVIRPNELTDIRSATLEWNGTHTVTDKVSLDFLEKRFSNSKYLSGGAKCCFGAILTLELGDGRTVKLRMADDDCASWMSEGVAYGFQVLTEDGYKDNTEFYSIFATEVIHEAAKGDAEKLWSYLPYMNWRLYDAKYGGETLALIDKIKNMVLNDPEKHPIQTVLRATNSLDGYMADAYASMLGELYPLHKKAILDYCKHTAYVENGEEILGLIAYALDLRLEELEAEYNKSKQ